MLFFSVNGKQNQLPESFSEFSRKQWIFFAQALLSDKYSSWDDIKIQFIRNCTSVPVKKIARLFSPGKPDKIEEFANHTSKLSPLLVCLNYFEKPIHLSSNPVPFICYGPLNLRKLFPPAPDLSNLKTWEMAYSTKYAKDFELLMAKSLKEEDSDIKKSYAANISILNDLISILYRPGIPGWKWRRKKGISPSDRRRKFFDALISVYSKKLKHVPLFKKILILWWFNSAYKSFSEQFADLFSKATDGDPDNFSWADMIVSFENSIPGDEEKIGDSYASLFLQRLVVQKRTVAEIKEKSNPDK